LNELITLLRPQARAKEKAPRERYREGQNKKMKRGKERVKRVEGGEMGLRRDTCPCPAIALRIG